MYNLLAVNFSTGLAAVLLSAAAIILFVMVAEAACMARLQKVGKQKPPEDVKPQEQPAEPIVIENPRLEERLENAETTEPPKAEQSREKPKEQTPLTKPEKAEEPRRIKPAEKVKGSYDKSFTARLILSDGDIKNLYSSLKNELLKRGFQSRVCWRYESFRAVKKLAAKLAIRGGGLCLFCALGPDDNVQFSDAVEDLSSKKTYKKTPLLCAVESGKKERISKRLIAELAQKFNLENAQTEECDFAALLSFEDFETLIEKGLIKVKKPVKKIRVKQLAPAPEKAEKPAVKTPEKTVKKRAEKGVKKVVNLDVIFACFESGEIATFEEIKKRVFGNNKNISYIKILGRGKADKNITVIANAFSRTAEKNILDAGGNVIKKND